MWFLIIAGIFVLALPFNETRGDASTGKAWAVTPEVPVVIA